MNKIKINNKLIDVKTFYDDNSYIYRFYNKQYEEDNKNYSNLVIVQTDYGYINVNVDETKVGSLISGYLNAKYFNEKSAD